MDKVILFVFLLSEKIQGTFSSHFQDQDVFITNTTSTYQDIPKDCKLVSAEFDHLDSIHLKHTDGGPFWVGAPKGSKRNISSFANDEIHCVAALLHLNVTSSFVSKLCTEELRSLCIDSGHKISLLLLAVIVGLCCSGILCLVVVSFLFAKCHRKVAMPQVEQEILSLPEHLSLPSEVPVAKSKKTKSIQKYETPLHVINSHSYEEPDNDEAYCYID